MAAGDVRPPKSCLRGGKPGAWPYDQTGTITWPGAVDLDPDVIYAALDLGPDKAQVYVLDRSIAA